MLAIAAFGTAQAQAPPNAQELFAQGFELLRANQPEQAASEFASGLRLEPNNALAYYYLGEALLRSGHPEQAQLAFQRSLAIDPSSKVADFARQRLAPGAPPSPAAETGLTPPRPAPPPADQPPSTPLPSPAPALSPAATGTASGPPAPLAPQPPARPLPPMIAALGLGVLPPRPQLQQVPAVDIPPSFCTEAARNDFHENIYAPANKAAFENNEAAKKYLDQLNELHVEYDQLENKFANAVTEEFNEYYSIASNANTLSRNYYMMHDQIVRTPIIACHSP